VSGYRVDIDGDGSVLNSEVDQDHTKLGRVITENNETNYIFAEKQNVERDQLSVSVTIRGRWLMHESMITVSSCSSENIYLMTCFRKLLRRQINMLCITK
jgi:hypothetical protein